MVDIQNTQEGIDLIRPGNDIRNVGYTSRRINQKMQVMNAYLDSDNADSTDNLQEPQGSGELQQISHFVHHIVGKNAFDEQGQNGIYIPSDGTYIVKCMVGLGPIDENDTIMFMVQKNAQIGESGEVILQKYIVVDHGNSHERFDDWVITDLNRGDVLYVGVGAWCQYSPYPIESDTHINLVKLS